MKLFDTYFVWFGQILAVSGKKNVSHKSPMCISGEITTFCVALSASVQQKKALKTQPRCAYMHTTPMGNVLEIPALGTSRYNFGSNGVH